MLYDTIDVDAYETSKKLVSHEIKLNKTQRCVDGQDLLTKKPAVSDVYGTTRSTV